MKLSINDKDLQLLLDKKQAYIGKKVSVVGLLEAILLIISAITESYDHLLIPGILIKFIIVLIAVIQVIFIIRDIHRPSYTKDDLLNDIKGLDIPSRTSSIVAIQNARHPSYYLVYEDTGWGMRLFPNYATAADDQSNIVRKLAEQLEIPAEHIHLSFKADGHETKFSTEQNQEREYFYRFYSAKIDSLGHEEEDKFEIAGRKYQWLTIDKMLQDQKIKENNSYVVGRVRDNT